MLVITREELLARYEAGERDFQGVILSDILLDSLGGVNLEGVNFSGAIFKHILFEPYRTTNITIGGKFINCNFSRSTWEFCNMPTLIGCNLQYALMRGCFFAGKFADCDWRYGRVIGADFDDMVFERCDLREGEWISGPFIHPFGVESGRGWGRGNFGIAFIDTLNEEIFSDIWTVWCKSEPPSPKTDEEPSVSNSAISDDSISF